VSHSTSEYNANYYQTHKDKWNQHKLEHPEIHRKASANYHKTHKEQINKKIRELTKKLRLKVLILLGNECANPDCLIPRDKLDKRLLQIDHIKGGGNKERIKMSRYRLYKRVIEHPENYQLLCVYCNWLKRYNKKEF
jgi:hypothetical protein